MFHAHKIGLTICILIVAGLFASGPARAADKKDKKDKKPSSTLLNKSDELTETDEKDTHPRLDKSPRKVYKVQFAEGKIYQIDLKSGDFDSVLRLEDDK